jgi:LacI family transcriptional regulator
VAAGPNAAVTIHDVARHAGVSSMSVSRVLNKRANVSEALREKVMRSVNALNYSMNMAAHSTRAGTGGFRIGILYSNPSASYLNEMLLGGLEQSSKLGCQLLLEKCAGLSSQKQAVKRLVDAGVDGVILPPPLCDSEAAVHMLKMSGIPALALATASPVHQVSAVRIDDFEAARTMTRYLIRNGHRRIGFIKGDPLHTPTLVRFNGYLAALTEGGIVPDETLVEQGMFTYQSGLTAGTRLLSREDRPTAIFASNDDMAAAVIALAHGWHIRVPEDLSVVGFDDTPVASTIWPQITTIHQPIVAMGRAAVSTIVEKIREIRAGRDAHPRQTLMKFTFMERGSSGPAPSGFRREGIGILPR